MSVETINEPNPGDKVFVSPPFPKAWSGKLLYAFYVVAMPSFAFWATELLKPEWQSGQLADYLLLLLLPEASLLFFVLLAYSVISYLLLLISPDRYAQLFSIRLGVYTGVLLALQYTVLTSVYLLNESPYPFFVPIWIFPLVYVPLYRWAVSRWSAKKVNWFLFIATIGILLLAMLITRSNATLLAFMALTIAAPFWCFLIAISTALWLFRNYETVLTFPRGAGLASWLAAYAVAWRFDILKMYELYAALPPQPPPDCYIATAAAQGHPKFVGSWLVRRANGESMCVNQQLQILKCAELALMAVQPRIHRVLRKAYDVLGKFLANGLRNPFLADAAYLLLRPWDRLARRGLRIIIPEIDAIASQMYGH